MLYFRLPLTVLVAGMCLHCSDTDDGTGSDNGNGGEEETPIGKTTVDIDTRMITTRTGEAPIGNFLTDAIKTSLDGTVDAVDIAVMNSGGMRGGPVDESFQFANEEARLGRIYPAGDLYEKDVAGWWPFVDPFNTVNLGGLHLKSVLERSVASLPPDLAKDEGGWFLHFAGMIVKVDCAGTAQKLNVNNDAIETEGSRITYIKVGADVVLDVPTGVDNLAGTTVKVAVSSFIKGGLDGHLGFAHATDGKELSGFDPVETIVNHIKANSPISPATDSRIAFAGACNKPGTDP